MFSAPDPYQYFDQAQAYTKPFYNIGLQDFQNLSNLSNNLTQNPVGFYNQIMGQYQMSPYAQDQEKYINQATANQAAAGGYLGTPQEMTDLQGNLNRLIAGDQQQYYQDVMQPFGMGFQGLTTGAHMGQAANRMLNQQLDLEGQLAAQQGSFPAQLLGMLAGGGMKYGLPALLGGMT